jgi:outer membrane protein assembly factor BamD
MFRVSLRAVLVLLCLLAFPISSPAPLIYRPGEGWTYEPVGSEGKWIQERAKDQLEVAEAAFKKDAFDLALKSARRVVKVWPLSDYAPRAQYLVGRCYEGKGNDEKAFKEYQRLIEKNPRFDNYQEVLQRQYEIANKYLAGKRFRLWGLFPLYRSMDQTADMYAKVVRNGPHSSIAQQAQLKIGTARDKQKNYFLAARAYETAADRYYDDPAVASTALYHAGVAYNKQARKAEYDQTTAGQAIATFTDFITLFPDDKRVPETQKLILDMRAEQARGSFRIARFYEKRHRYAGALVYYNEVLLLDPASPDAETARRRIDEIKNAIIKPIK